jgi:pyruvate-formate lyase
MTDLITCLSVGKGTWNEVRSVIEKENWRKVFIVTNDFGKQKYAPVKDTEFIVVDARKSLKELMASVQAAIKDKVDGTEVGLNVTSGSGKEHMAILGAILKSGLSFRLVAVESDKLMHI